MDSAYNRKPDEDAQRLLERLGDVTKSVAHRYAAKDDAGNVMDCLKIVPLGRGDFLGVYHAMKDTVFFVHAARSKDLLQWKHVATLDDHASQPTLHRSRDGSFLIAYEKDAPNQVWMRLRHYRDLNRLLKAEFQREKDLTRTLAPTAEGTPSVEGIRPDGGSPDKSVVTLRFHFYRNGDVDRAALGTLTGFEQWETRADDAVNEAFERLGVRGNLGDRDRFSYKGRTWYLQEAQMVKNGWDTWRVHLCDDKVLPIAPLTISTHKGSRSFANPTVTAVQDRRGRPLLAVTLFVPSQGSAPGESGELVYVVPLP